jgi:hypothetical protein
MEKKAPFAPPQSPAPTRTMNKLQIQLKKKEKERKEGAGKPHELQASTLPPERNPEPKP